MYIHNTFHLEKNNGFYKFCPFPEQSWRAGPARGAAQAAHSLQRSGSGHGVPGQEGLCAQRPCCQEHLAHRWLYLQGQCWPQCSLSLQLDILLTSSCFCCSADSRLWHVQGSGWWWLLHLQRRQDPLQVDLPGGRITTTAIKHSYYVHLLTDTLFIYRTLCLFVGMVQGISKHIRACSNAFYHDNNNAMAIYTNYYCTSTMSICCKLLFWSVHTHVHMACSPHRLCTTGSTRQPVTCGAMVFCCGRSGASDTPPIKTAKLLMRYHSYYWGIISMILLYFT